MPLEQRTPVMPAPTTEYVLDGTRITSLETFYDEISRVLIPNDGFFGRNLDAFNDILRGGFGTPDEGFTLIWINSASSRERLGYAETVRQLELTLAECHPESRDYVRRQLDLARSGTGPTVFDWLIKTIEDHGPSGRQSRDNVRLVLT